MPSNSQRTALRFGRMLAAVFSFGGVLLLSIDVLESARLRILWDELALADRIAVWIVEYRVFALVGFLVTFVAVVVMHRMLQGRRFVRLLLLYGAMILFTASAHFGIARYVQEIQFIPTETGGFNTGAEEELVEALLFLWPLLYLLVVRKFVGWPPVAEPNSNSTANTSLCN